MKKHRQLAAFFVTVLMAGNLPVGVCAAEGDAPGVPPFTEVYSLVRSNLAGMDETELNRAAVLGFVAQLQPQVMLVTNASKATDPLTVPLVSKSTVLDGAYGCLRIGRVEPSLATDIKRAYDQLAATNRLKGLIVDLRFGVGYDYAAAAQAADLFFKVEQPLLQWEGVTAKSTAKTAAIGLPMVILINQDTEGSAEALAVALRQREDSLIIGSPTAGRAYLFQDLSLSTGQTLRIGTGSISTGNGQKLARTGVLPDIRINVSPADEKDYFQDPYKVMAKPFAQAVRPATNELAALQSTNRARRPRNEAELVRMQRESSDPEAEPTNAALPQAVVPVITDPALARGLDLLKGLALASKRR